MNIQWGIGHMKYVAIVIGVLIIAALFLIRIPCEHCGSTGEVSAKGIERVKCGFCEGAGTVTFHFKTSMGKNKSECPRCGGEGYKEKKVLRGATCPECVGRGYLPLYRWIGRCVGL